MLQRPQTLFLALIVLSMALYLAFPIWQKSVGAETAVLDAYALTYTKGETTTETNTMYLAGLALVSAGLALFSLLQYTNRLRQMMLNLINTLVMVVLLGLSTYLSHIQANAQFAPQTSGSFKIGFFVLAVALLSNVAANRFIRIDEKKVKDAFERLR
ncbi:MULTISPECIES: DUF4293 domain-containing protein [Siphonobacter]|uniref:DUF4293 domain-containing protein n=1 Tax=Siphonobacter curvatus TaxID=2094562 RepID=A0A2S7IKB4_9BACT|nr:DUF4293 domain-containing protein [Siphonobacter curvatus]PQA58162.1 DUF4293 domain-containing protein [Siphonobacter curvatus]